MSKISFLFVLILLYFSAPFYSQASTIYINYSSGNDTTGNGTAETPYKTFYKGYTVANANDTLSLTGTFNWANADETGDASTSGYTLGKNLTIVGQGADTTIVQAASTDNTADRRIFTVSAGVGVTISGLTIRYGKVGSSQDGGGVYIDGRATINNCDISYNRAPDGSGGGVDVRGYLLIQNSTIHHNVAHYKGGGLERSYYSGSGGVPGAGDLLDIVNCTISHNQVTQTVAYLEGGGVFYRRGSGSITNSTIAYNTVVNGSGTSTHGIGTGDPGSTVALKNNIIANNTLNGCWSGEIGHREAGGGTFTDNGGNIYGKLGYYRGGLTPAATSWVDRTDGCASPDGVFVIQSGVGTTGQLYISSTLATNNTTTGTMTLEISNAASVSVDRGTTGNNGSIALPDNDQRGLGRNGTIDVGAFEFNGSSGPPTATPTPTNIPTQTPTPTPTPTLTPIPTSTPTPTNTPTPTGTPALTSTPTPTPTPTQTPSPTPITAGSLIYVNATSGNDTTGTGSQGAPFKTFHRGYQSVTSDGIIDLTGTFSWADVSETGDASISGYTINKNLTIRGQNAETTIIEAANLDNTADRRVLTINSGVGVTLQNVAIRYGKITGSGNDGGGIKNSGNLLVKDSEIYNNRAVGDGGGGISNRNKLIVENSAVYNNIAHYMGGGLLNNYYVVSGGYLNITNSTIAFNQLTATIAYTEGGGVHYRKGGGSITNSTTAFNSACGVGGVGMDDPNGVLIVKNNILAKNRRLNHPYCSNGYGPVDFDFRQNGYGQVTDNGNNIVGYSYRYVWQGNNDWIGATSWAGALRWDQSTFTLRGVGTTGSLNLESSLAVNGNSKKTQTLMLLANSVAIDNGNGLANGSVTIPLVDQRGTSREGLVDIGAYEFVSPPVDRTAPEISGLSVAPSATQATISWLTNEPANSQIWYDPNNHLTTKTPLFNSASPTQTHQITLTDLVSCSKYYYQVVSQDNAGNTANSALGSFITSGCPGSVAVASVDELVFKPAIVNNADVNSDVGQTDSDTDYQLNQTAGSLRFGLAIPRTFTENPASLQLKNLDSEAVIVNLSKPTGKSKAGSKVFDVKALADPSSTISSFSSAVTVNITYSDQDVVGLSEDSLRIYNHDGNRWSQLSDCQVDVVANIVTCTTNHFSVFGLFGQDASNDNSSSSTSSQNSSVHSAPSCNDSPPIVAPDLFQVKGFKTQAVVYFTPVANMKKYFISFSTKKNAEEHGTEFQLNDQGVQNQIINYLRTNTTYYFKVRAVNGCTGGPWSKVLAIKTGGKQVFNFSGAKIKPQVAGTSVVISKNPTPIFSAPVKPVYPAPVKEQLNWWGKIKKLLVI
jgi:hypothetical protein